MLNVLFKTYALAYESMTTCGIYPSSFINGRFWTKIEFLNVVKCQRGSRGAASSATGSWESTGGGSGSTVSEKFFPFYILRRNK